MSCMCTYAYVYYYRLTYEMDDYVVSFCCCFASTSNCATMLPSLFTSFSTFSNNHALNVDTSNSISPSPLFLKCEADIHNNSKNRSVKSFFFFFRNTSQFGCSRSNLYLKINRIGNLIKLCFNSLFLHHDTNHRFCLISWNAKILT